MRPFSFARRSQCQHDHGHYDQEYEKFDEHGDSLNRISDAFYAPSCDMAG